MIVTNVEHSNEFKLYPNFEREGANECRNDRVSVGEGKRLIGFFESLFRSNTFAWWRESATSSSPYEPAADPYYDVTHTLSQPHCVSERVEFFASNPISQAFSTLAGNLSKLDLYTSDPVGGSARPEDDHFNTDFYSPQSVTASAPFSHFLASYYTMGAFELQTLLFANTFQELHEAKLFEYEHALNFGDDVDDHDFDSASPPPVRKTATSLWSYPEEVRRSNSVLLRTTP